MKNKALVVGALGVVGRGLLNHLTRLDEWDTVALSRRPVDGEFNVPSVSVDLLDIDECRGKLRALTDVTHVFYVAYAPRATHAEEVEPNLRMLQNLMDGLDRAAPNLKHVSIMQRVCFFSGVAF
jgi:nucleoside-diphosphate-sugar epimerase